MEMYLKNGILGINNMSTPQLHDQNEEYWQTKLHIGCGGVYLAGYVNVDAQGSYAYSVGKSALLRNTRFITDYYAKLEGSWDNLPKANKVIVDVKSTMQNIREKFSDNSVDKIVAIQTMEHLDPIDFINALDYFYSLLDHGGVLIVSVPDMEESLDWLADPEKTEFTIRHLRGSLKDRWSIHRSWWTGESLENALAWVGFREIQRLENFHCYPSVVMRCVKYVKG